MSDIQVKMNAEGQEITLRQGAAPQIIIPLGTKTKFLPGSFPELIKKRLFDPASTLVRYNIPQGFFEIETNIQSTSQKGTDLYQAFFELNHKLKAFNINSDNMWGLKALGDHIKMNRNLFPDAEKALELAAMFKTLTATVNQKIDKHKDDRANSIDRFEQEVKTNLPEFFIMQAPILQGAAEPAKFKVDVNFHVRGRDVDVFLTSFELQEQFESEVLNIIEQLLEVIQNTQPDLIVLRLQ